MLQSLQQAAYITKYVHTSTTMITTYINIENYTKINEEKTKTDYTMDKRFCRSSSTEQTTVELHRFTHKSMPHITVLELSQSATV